MIVVDASVWVSRFTPDDLHHGASLEWLRRYIDSGRLVIAPGLLLAEVAGAISRRTGRARLGHRVVADLLESPALRLVPMDPVLSQAAARLAVDLMLRGADAVYVATAHHLTLPLVSWDREQRERAGSLIEVYAPDAEPSS